MQVGCFLMRAAGLAALVFLTPSAALRAQDAAPAVEYIPVPKFVEFSHATEPGSVRYACAAGRNLLEQHFKSLDAPFEPRLVRKIDGHGSCHIFYEPTLPGFRAIPDDRPITGLRGSIDPIGFLADRRPIGDSLDIIKTVIARISQPVDVILRVARPYSPDLWEPARLRHFAGVSHPIEFRDSGHDEPHPWVQDQFKAGEVGGELALLAPRRLYEGREADGDIYAPVLAMADDATVHRSKLSWEGGDLQFVMSPKEPGKLILIHGGSAQKYWGQALTAGENGYVLRREFGADLVVDVTRPGVHADYVVAFVPRERIAFVSRPIYGRADIFRAIAAALSGVYGADAPKRLARLAQSAAIAGPEDEAGLADVKLELETLRHELEQIPSFSVPAVDAALGEYFDQECPASPETCLTPVGKARMLAIDPDLLRRAADYAADQDERETVGAQLFGLLEGQLPDAAPWGVTSLDQAADAFRALGFKVVRVPMLVAPNLVQTWAGVGYTNMLVAGQQLFVPTFGLGKAEEKLIAGIQSSLPKGYTVIPARARGAISKNGGAHCVFGIIRDPTTNAPGSS